MGFLSQGIPPLRREVFLKNFVTNGGHGSGCSELRRVLVGKQSLGLEVVGPSERVCSSRLCLVLVWLLGLQGDEVCFLGAGGSSLCAA